MWCALRSAITVTRIPSGLACALPTGGRSRSYGRIGIPGRSWREAKKGTQGRTRVEFGIIADLRVEPSESRADLRAVLDIDHCGDAAAVQRQLRPRHSCHSRQWAEARPFVAAWLRRREWGTMRNLPAIDHRAPPRIAIERPACPKRSRGAMEKAPHHGNAQAPCRVSDPGMPEAVAATGCLLR